MFLAGDRVLIKRPTSLTGLIIQESFRSNGFWIIVANSGKLEGELVDKIDLISRKAKKKKRDCFLPFPVL